jgi:hypothetical protein
MGLGEFIKAATERQKEKRAAQVAKQAKRKEVQATRKEMGEKKRTRAKEIRKELKGKERRAHLGANRVFHKVDKEGKPGGMLAFSKYSAKVGAQNKKREDRKKARADRKAARSSATRRADASDSS